ncbi:hypothetical protein LCGC14_1209910 [marine sediment metagenome]|uniref:Glucokinase n=1 Tax=marine sediment metagenome TaxID=412755 RepID=A0A0F9NWR6_9ZZZZ|nr:glucokinase [Methylophaga aminisulfidivorans]
MSTILAVDIGGTKTLFGLFENNGKLRHKMRFESQTYETFEAVLSAFLETFTDETPISSACIAIAGPVNGQYGKVTKLPWQIDAELISHLFSIEHVRLCNDFEAVGYGISTLRTDELLTLQEGKPLTTSPRVVLGAGTGLGQALLIPSDDDWQVIATEGGHVDFAPQNATQLLLLEHLIQRHGHVSYDRIVCGSGLVSIYNFLRDYKQLEENTELRLMMVKGDAAAAISQFAQQGDSLSKQALDMFISIYAAQAGNLALTCLARGGVYLAGGIILKNLSQFQQGEFIHHFQNKGRMSELMADMPIHIVLNEELGLNGARLLAEKAMYN